MAEREKTILTFGEPINQKKPPRRLNQSFADVRPETEVPGGDSSYQQTSWLSSETVQPEAIEVHNLLVVQEPSFSETRRNKRVLYDWQCNVVYEPDLWNQEDHGAFVLHAQENALAAKALNLHVNDTISVHGVLSIQPLPLHGGGI